MLYSMNKLASYLFCIFLFFLQSNLVIDSSILQHNNQFNPIMKEFIKNLWNDETL